VQDHTADLLVLAPALAPIPVPVPVLASVYGRWIIDEFLI
jgi:hypothetical protein